MSKVVETFLSCDGDSPDCRDTFGVDMRHRSVNEHRESAREEGWVYRKGKDFCPECVKHYDEVIANTTGIF